MAGVTPGLMFTDGKGNNTSREPLIPVNGTRGTGNNVLLDGGDMVIPFQNTATPLPNPDALQEFTIILNSADAQYGQGAGATITAVTKSGTNDFHGSAYDF